MIEQRKEEIQFPYRPSDVNADIKAQNKPNDSMDNLVAAIGNDRVIRNLDVTQKAIAFNLEHCDNDTRTIIEELYLKRYPRYTMDGLIVSEKIKCKRSKAYDLRNEFFENVAKDLNLL